MRTNLSHLHRSPEPERAATLVALYAETQAAAGSPTFGPHLTHLLARLCAEHPGPTTLHLNGYTLHAEAQGGHHHVALYRGRRSAADCRSLARAGDQGILDEPSLAPRTDRRLLAALLDPLDGSSAWKHLDGPVARLAVAALVRPEAPALVQNLAARLDVPGPITSIPVDVVRRRGRLTISQALAIFAIENGATQAQAAEMLGMGDPSQIRSLVRAAKAKGAAPERRVPG